MKVHNAHNLCPSIWAKSDVFKTSWVWIQGELSSEITRRYKNSDSLLAPAFRWSTYTLLEINSFLRVALALHTHPAGILRSLYKQVVAELNVVYGRVTVTVNFCKLNYDTTIAVWIFCFIQIAGSSIVCAAWAAVTASLSVSSLVPGADLSTPCTDGPLSRAKGSALVCSSRTSVLPPNPLSASLPSSQPPSSWRQRWP